jgi:hypothetical protein
MQGAYACLMYHELERPGRELSRTDSGYVRYVISESLFRTQLDTLTRLELQGCSVGEALTNSNSMGARVVLTFDDGCETDYAVAAPLLQQRQFNATFYIVTGYLGRRGHLSTSQLRELHQLGFEIGSHSVTHPYLCDLEMDELTSELKGSKQQLEQILGAPVHHFSCPGGRWDARVAAVARASGYASVATSRIGINHAHSDPFCLARLAITGRTSPEAFELQCRGRGLLLRRVSSQLLDVTKNVLGNGTYEKLHAALLQVHGSVSR